MAGAVVHHHHHHREPHHHQHHHHHQEASHPHPPPLPFHLIEVTVLSAQDLHAATRAMRSYAVAWVHPDHKLRTRLDGAGHTDPSWNHKFVFRVSGSFLRSDTSQVNFELYAARSAPFADALVGTARLVLSAMRPSTATRFVAIQVRRPASLRPQGILNVGVALLDSYARSAPLLYADLPPSAAAIAGGGGEGYEEENHRSPRRINESGVIMQRKLLRWRSELPPPSELEKRRERKERRLDDDREKKKTKERREPILDGGYDRRGKRERMFDDGYDMKQKREQVEDGRVKVVRRPSFGRLSCFGGGKGVEESGARY